MRKNRSTYIRKVGDGLYEYGWHLYGVNFRKATPYEPVGWEHTIPNAEAKRAELQASVPQPVNG